MKIKLKKKKNQSSSLWLKRHLNDKYFQLAKQEGYRSRASYKLIQINEKFKIFQNSKKILDLGSAPGGWLQVIKRFSSNNSTILGIDKLNIQQINGINLLKLDIFSPKIFNEILFFFGNEKIDLILSDMSPNSSGNKNVDHIRIVSMVEQVLNLSSKILKKNGFLVSKIFQGGAQGELLKSMKNELNNIKYFKPDASRRESPETYLVGKKK